jgi:hypothetical protein
MGDRKTVKLVSDFGNHQKPCSKMYIFPLSIEDLLKSFCRRATELCILERDYWQQSSAEDK